MENIDQINMTDTLKKLLAIAPKLHFIKHLNRIFQYSDEPKFYQYSAEIYIDRSETDGQIKAKWKAGGSSMFDEKYAFLKCLAEAIERYSCMAYRRSDLVYDSFNNLKNKSVDPSAFCKFTVKQKRHEQFVRYVFDKNTPFTWIKAKSIRTNITKLVPAQLVYFNYLTSDKYERLIDIPISTGAAFGQSSTDAIVRGFLELVERDSFSIMYMNIPHINPRPLGRWKKYSRVILFPWYSNTGMGVTLNIG